MSKRIKKLEQLDSLRAIAAFSVIIFHFLRDYKLGNFTFGWIGVDLFFVISGYLITAILIEQKIVVLDKFTIIKNFIIKRCLRLFPTYYLFITAMFFLMIALGGRAWNPGEGIYYYTYTQNILFFREGMKGVQLNHVWSLAVEEQFYLVWPWLVIYIPNKILIRMLVIIIPLTLFFKSFSEIEGLKMLTVAHFDTLGGGALIALLLKEKGEQFFALINRIKGISILISLLILTAATFYTVANFFIVLSIFTLSASLLIGSYFNFVGLSGKILDLSWLKYLGKISYGLYLYHKPVPFLIINLTRKMNIEVNHVILMVVSVFITVLTAYISYNAMEKHFLKLKEKFDL
jgi:peptidoglycan/LPS O-acetylase OafA/YrhL